MKRDIAARRAVYEQARKKYPQRWSTRTRDFIDAVHLNPDSNQTKESAADRKTA